MKICIQTYQSERWRSYWTGTSCGAQVCQIPHKKLSDITLRNKMCATYDSVSLGSRCGGPWRTGCLGTAGHDPPGGAGNYAAPS